MAGWIRTTALAVVGIAIAVGTGDKGSEVRAADPDRNYTTWGAGADSCGQWLLLRQKETPLAYYVHAQWIQGYITAFNAWNHDSDDIAEGFGPEQLFTWIDGFCGKYPGETLANGSLALMQALTERQKADKASD